MGGGLNFLNKKTWHPARPQNLEEVWKREQQAAAEAKKAEELRKQLEEERKRSEYVQMAMDTGHLRKEERLDWMYASGLQAKQDAEKRREDMLTGKADVVVAPEQRPEETSRAEQVALLPSFYASATPASQNETWLRLNNDPLFAIKRQQQEQLAKLKENPIKMMELLKNLTKAKEKSEKKKEKKDKKEKKEKKSKKRERGSDTSSDEGDGRAAKRSRSPPELSLYGAGGAGRGPALEHPPVAGARGRSPEPRDERPRDWAHGPHHQQRLAGRDVADPGPGRSRREQEYGGERERYDREHDREYNTRAEPHGHGRGARDDSWRDHRPHERGESTRHDSRRLGSEREYDRKREYDDERDYDREREQRRPRGEWDGDLVRERGPDRDSGRERQPQQDNDRDRDHGRQREHDREGGRHGARGRGREQDQSPPHTKRDGEERRGGGGGGAHGSSPGRTHEGGQANDRYGLKHSAVAPEALLQADTRNRAAETRARLEEARRVKEEEERAKAAQRYTRKDYKTGQITDEERQRRLAEMMGDAAAHEAQRRRRLDDAAAEDAVEGNQRLVNQSDAIRGSDAFRDAAARDVYSKLQGSLEARVNSRRHFSAR